MTNLDRSTIDVNTEHEPFLRKQDNVVGLKKALFTVTFFENQSAQIMFSQQITLGQLRHYILTARKPSKDKLLWLKLASFGNKRSDKNSLRNNANVLSISGVELDYDSKVMQLDEAIGIAQKAGLLALLYTTASYTAATPKWRILLPTSKPLPPGERAKLVARVNGLYGDIFDQASFTLSQAYYFGCVGDNPEHRAVITEGDFIDLRDDLDAGAIFGKTGTHKSNGGGESDYADGYERLEDELKEPIDLDQLLNDMVFYGTGNGGNVHPTELSYCSSQLNRGMSVDEVIETLHNEILNRIPESHDWDWSEETETLQDMCTDWLRKHPELEETAYPPPENATPPLAQSNSKPEPEPEEPKQEAKHEGVEAESDPDERPFPKLAPEALYGISGKVVATYAASRMCQITPSPDDSPPLTQSIFQYLNDTTLFISALI
jgi:hypothetical protein